MASSYFVLCTIISLFPYHRAHSVAGRLIGMRLVLGEPGKSGRLDMKVRLNVSTDDVNFALKKDYA